MFSALAVWAALPEGLGTRMPRFGGQVNGSVSVMRRYSVDVRIMPR